MNSGGGVAYRIDNTFQVEIIDEVSIFDPNIMESIFIKLKFGDNKYNIIGNIYRAPDGDITKFKDTLVNIINRIDSNPNYKKAKNVIMVGDMNINLLKNNTHQHTNTYTENLFSRGYIPTITLPTRVHNSIATLIDHIFLKYNGKNGSSGIITTSLSDHFTTFLIINDKIPPPPIKESKVRKINTKTIPSFLTLLKDVPLMALQRNIAHSRHGKNSI